MNERSPDPSDWHLAKLVMEREQYVEAIRGEREARANYLEALRSAREAGWSLRALCGPLRISLRQLCRDASKASQGTTEALDVKSEARSL